MSDGQPIKQLHAVYIETPRMACRPEKISSVLEKRMKEFIRRRRRLVRQELK